MTAQLAPGAGALLYTDGLPEARTARAGTHHELFGEEAAPADDLCLVAVRLDGDAAAQPQAA